MAGLDPILGFVMRTAEDLNRQLSDEQIANISPALDTSSTSPMGQINSSVTKIAAELWELGQAIYNASDPDKATGDGQDAVCAITGTTREEATKTQVRCALGMNAGSTVPIGSLASILGNPTVQFELVGTEAIAGTVVDEDLVSVGAGTYTARFQCTVTGPVIVNAGTLSVIVTPQTGWNAITNPTDGAPGQNIESSAELRIRREQELAAAGSTPVDALRAEMAQLLEENHIVDGFADVFENVGDDVDTDGRLPHSLEVLIDDGVSPLSDDVIAQRIWKGKGGGIQLNGSTFGDAVDDIGVTRAIAFNRPTPKPVYWAVILAVNPNLYPADGDTQVKDAIVALGRTLNPGVDVARNQFFGPIFSVAGVINVTVLHLGFAPAPVLDADLVIGVRERATFDTSRITVTH